MTRAAWVWLSLNLVATRAFAHKNEIGLSIEPCFAMLPAVAPGTTSSTLAPVLGGTLGVEYYVVNDLAVMLRVGYLQSFGDSLIGNATFDHITGAYYFQQSAVVMSAGVRVETPPTFLPISFFATATGGAAILIQTNQDLRDPTGISYGLTLNTVVRTVPMALVGGGISGRVSDQIRLAIEPALMTLFAARPVFGFSLTASLTFFFYP